MADLKLWNLKTFLKCMFDSWWNGLLEYDSSKSCDTIPWLYVALCKNISLTRVYQKMVQ